MHVVPLTTWSNHGATMVKTQSHMISLSQTSAETRANSRHNACTALALHTRTPVRRAESESRVGRVPDSLGIVDGRHVPIRTLRVLFSNELGENGKTTLKVHHCPKP